MFWLVLLIGFALFFLFWTLESSEETFTEQDREKFRRILQEDDHE